MIKMAPLVEADLFMNLWREMSSLQPSSPLVENIRFQDFWWVSPKICSIAWNYLADWELMPRGGKPTHLLWELLFLKQYSTENIIANTVKTSEKRFVSGIGVSSKPFPTYKVNS